MSRLPSVDEVEVWSILDVSNWLKKIGVDDEGRLSFQDKYIDGVKLLELTETDLSLYPKVKIKYRKLILKHIKELNAAVDNGNKKEKKSRFFNKTKKAPKALPTRSAVGNPAHHGEDSDSSFDDPVSPTSQMSPHVPGGIVSEQESLDYSDASNLAPDPIYDDPHEDTGSHHRHPHEDAYSHHSHHSYHPEQLAVPHNTYPNDLVYDDPDGTGAVHDFDYDDPDAWSGTHDATHRTSGIVCPVPYSSNLSTESSSNNSSGLDSDEYEKPCLPDSPAIRRPAPPPKEDTPPPRPPKPGQTNGAPGLAPRRQMPSASDDSDDNEDDYITPGDPPCPSQDNPPETAPPPPLPIHSPPESDEVPPMRPSVPNRRDHPVPPPSPGSRPPAKFPPAENTITPPPLPPSRPVEKKPVAQIKPPVNHRRSPSPALSVPEKKDKPNLPHPPSPVNSTPSTTSPTSPNPRVPLLPVPRNKQTGNEQVLQEEEQKKQSVKDRIAQLNKSSHTDSRALIKPKPIEKPKRLQPSDSSKCMPAETSNAPKATSSASARVDDAPPKLPAPRPGKPASKTNSASASRVGDTPPELPAPRPIKPEREDHKGRDLPPIPTSRHPGIPTPPSPDLPTEGLYQFPWYHSNLTRTMADQRLKAMNKESGFLIRKSSKDPAKPYTLAIYFNDKVWNLNVRLKSDGTYAIGLEKPNELTFRSVDELVQHHCSHDILLAGSNGGVTKLLHPLRK